MDPEHLDQSGMAGNKPQHVDLPANVRDAMKSQTAQTAGRTEAAHGQAPARDRVYGSWGCDKPHILNGLTRESRTIDEETGATIITPVLVKPGVPLTLDEVARVLHLKKRYIRQLLALPIVQNALAVEVQRLRTGEHARASIHTLLEIRDDPGHGKAADRKVRMQAAESILGEREGSRGTNGQRHKHCRRAGEGRRRFSTPG